MRNTLLLIWWILTPLLVALTIFGPRLLGDPTTGTANLVGPAIAVATILWIVFSVGLVLTRGRSDAVDTTPDHTSDSGPA